MTQKLINLAPTTEESSSYQTSNTVSTRDFKVLRRKLDEQGKELQSSIAVNAGEIQLLSERVGEAEASIIVNADAIATKVSTTDLNTTLSNYSTITQTATQIATRVATTDYNGNTIASLINQTATTIQISASKINLNGYVTVSNLTDGVTTIDGGNIRTGTINADRITAGYLSAGSVGGWVLTANSIYKGTTKLDASNNRIYLNSAAYLDAGTTTSDIKVSGGLQVTSRLNSMDAIIAGMYISENSLRGTLIEGSMYNPIKMNGNTILTTANFSLVGSTLNIYM